MAFVGQVMRDIERCPQCNVAHPTLHYRHHYWDTRQSGLVWVWFAYICASCQNLVGAKVLLDAKELKDPNLVVLSLATRNVTVFEFLPPPRTVDEDVPERPRAYLLQAIDSLSSPDGATMLAGSAVDAMLKLKNYKEGTVYARINEAVKDHILTTEMGEWAHSVRLESNKPRHADLDEPHATRAQADQSVQFALALAEYLFALPARVARGKATASEGSAA
jgi:hypothetical protein